MTDLVIGAVSMAGFLLLFNYVRENKLLLSWWQWTLVILGFLYAVFVLEVIVSFLEEGSAQAALVMGTLLGFVAIVWGVLVGRFVVARARCRDRGEA
jgi:ethanolamine transporter EutH